VLGKNSTTEDEMFRAFAAAATGAILLGSQAPRRRLRHPGHLLRQRPTVCRHRLRRRVLLCFSLLAALLLAEDQPIPYCHKTHLKMGLKCNECHTMPGKGEAATFPAESKCMTCHTAIKEESKHIRLLAEYVAKKEPVPGSASISYPASSGSPTKSTPPPSIAPNATAMSPAAKSSGWKNPSR
jgi:hypothetical protein